MTPDKKADLKQQFLAYYRDLPILKLAAASIGRDEDTLLLWKKEDADFADQVEKAKAEWALSNVKRVHSREWLLERILKNHFAPRTELTGEEGETLKVVITEAKHPGKEKRRDEAGFHTPSGLSDPTL